MTKYKAIGCTNFRRLKCNLWLGGGSRILLLNILLHPRHTLDSYVLLTNKGIILVCYSKLPKTRMSVCRSIQLCDLPERQWSVKQGTTVLSCPLADTAVSSSDLISFPQHSLMQHSPQKCSSHDSSLIRSEIRTQLYFFFLSPTSLVWRSIHLDTLIYRLADPWT